MIKNFEEATQPLTDYERQTLLPLLLCGLRTKKGKRMAVTNRTIVEKLTALGHKLDSPRVRKKVNHIRTADLIPGLVADSSGYYIAQSEEELKEYEESLYGREEAIKAVRLAIARQRRLLYGSRPAIV